jgi:hypothetical protein
MTLDDDSAILMLPPSPPESRLLPRQLVRQLRPLAFDHGAHFIRDVVDVLDLQRVFVESL